MKRLILIVLTMALCFFCTTAVADLILPAGTEVIEEEAFKDIGVLGFVTLNEGLKRIESKAFAGCEIWRINLPSSLEYLADDAFDIDYYSTGISFTRGTYAESWGIEHHLLFSAYAEPVRTDSYMVTWDAVSDVEEYEVFAFTDSELTNLYALKKISEGNTTYFTTDVGTQYYFIVGYGYNDTSIFSNTCSPDSIQPISAPENPTATMLDEETVLITWDPIPDVAGYRVYFSRLPERTASTWYWSTIGDDEGFDPTVASLILPLPGVDQPLGHDSEEGETWYFWICADSENGPNYCAFTYAQTTDYLRPTGVYVQAANTDYYYIRWDEMLNATGYRIYWSADGTVTKDSDYVEFGSDETDTLFVMTPGQQRYFAISALYGDEESRLTRVMTDIPLEAMPAPENARVEGATTDGIVHLAWDAVPGATNYRIFFSASPEYDQNNWHIYTDSDQTSFDFDLNQYGFNSGSVYFWITVQTDLGPGYPSEMISHNP